MGTHRGLPPPATQPAIELKADRVLTTDAGWPELVLTVEVIAGRPGV